MNEPDAGRRYPRQSRSRRSAPRRFGWSTFCSWEAEQRTLEVRLFRQAALLALVVALALGVASPADAKGPNNVAAKACQNGGYLNYQTTSGAPFKDEGACKRYAARGGILVPVPVVVEQPAVDFYFTPVVGDGSYCEVHLVVQGLDPNTAYPVSAYVDGSHIGTGSITTDSTGSYDATDIGLDKGHSLSYVVGGITSPVKTSAC